MVKVTWRGGMAFEAVGPSGRPFIMDALDGEGLGPSPLEAFLASVAGCAAFDVLAILQKKRQKVTAYHIEVEWTRVPEGTYPRPVTGMTVRHVVEGEVSVEAIERALELTVEKYCTVMATLRQVPTVVNEYRIVSA